MGEATGHQRLHELDGVGVEPDVGGVALEPVRAVERSAGGDEQAE